MLNQLHMDEQSQFLENVLEKDKPCPQSGFYVPTSKGKKHLLSNQNESISLRKFEADQ